MITCATDSVDQTRELAGAIAAHVTDGDLLMLVGDLGAGKTAFAQGFARALGVEGRVTSPTFTLANRYEGRRIVHHLDAYRVQAFPAADDLALPELLDTGVVLVEWGDNILPILPADRLEVRIHLGDGDDDRCFEISWVGPSWLERGAPLIDTLSPWRSEQC